MKIIDMIRADLAGGIVQKPHEIEDNPKTSEPEDDPKTSEPEDKPKRRGTRKKKQQ